MSTMVYITFALGALLILSGLYAFVRRWQDQGAVVRIWKILTVESGLASTLLIVVGALFITSAIYLQARISGLVSDLAQQKAETKNSEDLITDLLASVTSAVKDAAEPRGREIEVQAFDGEQFALSLLRSLSKDTFGFLKLGDEAVPSFAQLVETLGRTFPQSADLAAERLNIYRTLYDKESDKKQARIYLEKWGGLAKEMRHRESLPPNLRLVFLTHLGVYYQEKKQHEEAILAFEQAQRLAPSDVQYKILYNQCNSLLEIARKRLVKPAEANSSEGRRLLLTAIERCKESVQRTPKSVKFWQPLFNQGLAQAWRGNTAEAAKTFLEGYQIAQAGGEVDKFEDYLQRQPEVESLCADKAFHETFRHLCD